MAMIEIEYVGNKVSAHDNVARSGKTWNGKGDVQTVTDAQAKILLRHPDQFALANKKDAAKVSKPKSIIGKDADGNEMPVDPDVFKKPLENMEKHELVAYAKFKWGKELSPNQRTAQMIDQIEEWELTEPPIVGAIE